jgi:Tfp pilus assembly protein PilF
MKSDFFLLLGFSMALCFCGCSTTKTTQSQPEHFEADTVNVAIEQYHSGKLETANENLQAVLKVEPKNQKAQYYLSLIEKSQATPRKPLGYYQTIPQQPIY